MIIINDFFKRKKEAVSNQMELLLNATGGKIITATRFMNQKSFQKEDRKDKIYIYPPVIYHIVLFFSMIFTRDDIHIFEEEPQLEKRFLFNTFNKNVYVSMYRQPFKKYAEHLKKYKNLKGVFVELENHKKELTSYGINEKIIHISPTPAKIPRKENRKKYDPNDVKLLFASWNNKEGNPLYERGLVYILDLLEKNPTFSLTILLRDNCTKEFIQILNNRNLFNRVELLDIREEDLIQAFDSSDYVIFAIQKKLTKDVPNSLIDGLSRGKPIILTDIFGLSDIVKLTNSGIIIKPNSKAIRLNITKQDYEKMSKNAYTLSENYTARKYVDSIIRNYEVKK